MPTEDQQLASILLRQANDTEAWEKLDKLYRRRLTCYVKTFFKDPNDCENIVQEAFAGLYHSFSNGRFDENRSLQSYLYTIAHNTVISEIRKKKRGIRPDGDAGDNIAHRGPGASSLLRSEEDRLRREIVIVAALREYLSSLKQARRYNTIKILELTWIHGLGNNEAAEMLGVPPQDIANHKFQGKKALAEIVKRTANITHPDLI